MPDAPSTPREPRSWRLRVHDEPWALYLVTGLAGLFSGLSCVLRALDGGPWLLWVLAALCGLLFALSVGVLVSVRRRRRGAPQTRSWTRPA